MRIGMALLGASQLFSADAPPTVERGATRDEVIAAFGRPRGQSKLGRVEILHFQDRQVRLENGRVERISAIASASSRAATAPVAVAPVPVSPEPAPVATKGVTPAGGTHGALAEVWMTNFEDATREAARRNSVVLALFTNSDASPTSRQFQQQITLHPEFVNAFRAHYVLLQIDFPVRTELDAELRLQNAALRERYGVNTLPSLLILSAEGERISSVEIGDSLPGSAFRARLIAAATAAYELPVVEPPAPPPPEEIPKPVPQPTGIIVAPAEITSGLTTARWLITAALVVGTLLAGVMMFFLWLLISRINKPVALYRANNMASRISQAASGLPTFAEIGAWPKETLRHVIIRLAKTDGYQADEQPLDSHKDILLKRPGSAAPEIVVCCYTGNAGIIPMRRVREMVGLMAAEGVPAGWMVAPMGFAIDARAYAEQNNIRLLDASVLLNQLADLPTFALPKVLPMAANPSVA